MNHITEKILPREELARRSYDLRAAGRRLVLTNGCFDLLHVGHVRYLAAARSMGDVLAVGINSDASVRRLKGPNRPVNPQADRAEVLAALESVDFVTVFDEDTATALAEIVSPSVYVKGGDYSSDPSDPNFPIEGLAVLQRGGQVRTVDYVPGRSTSEILRQLGSD